MDTSSHQPGTRTVIEGGPLRLLLTSGLLLVLAFACGTEPEEGRGGHEDTGQRPQPYTPCCQGMLEPTNLRDPNLPADGPGHFLFVKMARIFVDTERNRSIAADVIVPSDDGVSMAAAGAPYPVVVVAHGFSGFRDMVLPYAERLATWGYITITPQLPFTGFLDIFNISHLESALDVLFLLNAVCCESETDPESLLYGKADGGRLAAVGHSLGGKLSVLASLLDGGLRAVVGLDPVDGAGPQGLFEDDPDFPDLVPELVPNLKIPTLYLGGTEGGSTAEWADCAPQGENYHQFWTYSPGPSVEIAFQGADHTDFLKSSWLVDLFDFCNVGTADPEVVKALALKYTVAFLNDSLLGWERYREEYAGTGAEADRESGHVTWQEKSPLPSEHQSVALPPPLAVTYKKAYPVPNILNAQRNSRTWPRTDHSRVIAVPVCSSTSCRAAGRCWWAERTRTTTG